MRWAPACLPNKSQLFIFVSVAVDAVIAPAGTGIMLNLPAKNNRTEIIPLMHTG